MKVAGTHQPIAASANDDAAEASLRANDRSQGNDKKREKSKCQNKAREFGSSRDERQLCPTRVLTAEFSPEYCKFEEKCKHEHDLRKYLKDYRREDLSTFGGNCPVWELKGNCERGWKCLFVKSHMEERQSEDGRNELVLLARDENGSLVLQTPKLDRSSEVGVLNIISPNAKYAMMKRTVQTPQADVYSKWLEVNGRDMLRISNIGKTVTSNGISVPITDEERKTKIENLRAQFTEPPFLPSEKRRIHFGPETPVLAPLTTQGNLPFRRLCVSMGAQLTYSEMAMSKPLVQGQGSEWALMKVHETEITPPRFDAKSIVTDYNNSRDLKFGAQISGSKPELVLKATAHLTQLCPYLRVIDLNCGCPIDLVYRSGAGAALLDSQPKLERIVRGMNAISGEIPITVKIRTGTSNEKPTALKLINRLVYGTTEMNELNSGVSGVAAITLHGRSRQQRYTKNANWEYISECAALIKRHVEKGYDLADTIREADPRYQSPDGKVYFVGNGDCYSHTDYHQHMENTGVDSVMVARGALIKPWIFEEIEKGQYLDKTATERLAIVEQFVRNGLETWGSDEMGVGTTRRFLLEWLSFAYRYVPVGLLEYLPPSLQDRAPAWRGRNELETLLGSDNYLDWIKIRQVVALSTFSPWG